MKSPNSLIAFWNGNSRADGQGADPASLWPAYTTGVGGAVTKADALTQVLYLQEAGDAAAISVNDIHQGQIGDCFLLSSIGELALTHPGAITQMIVANADGTETVTLYGSASGGIAGFGATSFTIRPISVTNVFPSNAVNNGATQGVVNSQKEIWVQVLEKAVATFDGGYGAISNGGNPMIAMQELTGCTASSLAPAALTLQTLQSDVAAGDLITCDTGNAASLPYGLVGSHAYMFESLSVVAGTEMVQLGNPWGFDQPALIPLAKLSQGIVEVDVGQYAARSAIAIAGVVASQATTDAASLHPFAALSLSDGSEAPAVTATVTLSAVANGGLIPASGAGTYNPTTGIYSVSGTVSAVTTALDSLTFVPKAHQVAPRQSEPTTLRLAVTDGSGGSANATTSVAATAIADAPTLSGTLAAQAVNDVATIRPFATLGLAEPDAGQTLVATVTLSAPANGSLGTLGTGSYSATSGVYTVSGSVAAVTTQLDNLVFTPTPHQLAPGSTVTTGFTIKISDTAGATTTNTTTSVLASQSADVVARGATFTVTGNQGINTIVDDGTVSITGASVLRITGAVDPSSTGLFQLQAHSLLEIASAANATPKIQFLGHADDRLTIDSAASFGGMAGAASYAGPLLENFAVGDSIDIKGAFSTAIGLTYSASTGDLQIAGGGNVLATLAFQTTSLGAGTFHAASDNSGGLLITHT